MVSRLNWTNSSFIGYVTDFSTLDVFPRPKVKLRLTHTTPKPMPINRLRQILRSTLQIEVDSLPATVTAVQNRVAKRVQDLTSKGKTMEIKSPFIVAGLQQVPNFTLRPIDLLRKIGQLTNSEFAKYVSFFGELGYTPIFLGNRAQNR